MKEYIAQPSGTWCFVAAVFNSLIHQGLYVPDLEEAKDIAGCRSGNAIHRAELVKWAHAPLCRAENYRDVLMYGGVLTIMHPVYNGHCLFCFPDGKWKVTLVNSWLGPNVMPGIAWDEIEPFVAERQGVNVGENWQLVEGARCSLAEAMAKLWEH